MALSIYCSSITVFFILIKMTNYRLHLMFDEGEAVVRSSLSDLSKAQEKKSNASDSCLPASIRLKTLLILKIQSAGSVRSGRKLFTKWYFSSPCLKLRLWQVSHYKN